MQLKIVMFTHIFENYKHTHKQKQYNKAKFSIQIKKLGGSQGKIASTFI